MDAITEPHSLGVADAAYGRLRADILGGELLPGMKLKLDALRSRSDAAEKLAAGVRQSLIEHTEAMRTAEANLLQVILACGEAEQKVEHLAVVSS